jgi:hypothetical protein
MLSVGIFQGKTYVQSVRIASSTKYSVSRNIPASNIQSEDIQHKIFSK